MGNDLKDRKLPKEFKVPNDQKQKTDMKQNQEDPQNRLVTSHRWEGKCIIKGPQPFGVFLRINLQGRRVLGFPKNLDQTNYGADEKNGKGYINHRHQDKIDQRIHDSLQLVTKC